jgi:hypothetical protein
MMMLVGLLLIVGYAGCVGVSIARDRSRYRAEPDSVRDVFRHFVARLRAALRSYD